MKNLVVWLVFLAVAIVGCDNPSATSGDNDTASTADGVGAEANMDTDTGAERTGENSAASDSSVPETSGSTQEIALTPENTKIQFVGTHVGDDPRPRKGAFEQFAGTATVTDGQLTAVQVQIETASLTTEIERLTNHLKSPDFFDVREYPQATFTSTSIAPASDGQVNVTGNLTLLETTQSLTFPASVSTDNGLTLTAEFMIDRMAYGIDHSPEGVEKDVAITITINGQ